MRTLIQSSHREVARAMVRAERATRTTTRSYATAATQARSSSQPSRRSTSAHNPLTLSPSPLLSSPLLPHTHRSLWWAPEMRLEYQSLRQRAQAAVTQPGLTGRKITYGCAEVATPTEFVAVLAGLGGSA